jgi:ABC-type branched-subunit amino acid transport system ATPase component
MSETTSATLTETQTSPAGSPGQAAVVVEDLRKSYGGVPAVDGVSFAVERGEVFGLLGPNGAGKTTTVEIIEGLRRADGGRVRVCGYDPAREAEEVKRRLGVGLQATALPDKIRVREALQLFGSFYPRQADADELLAPPLTSILSRAGRSSGSQSLSPSSTTPRSSSSTSRPRGSTRRRGASCTA